MSLCVFFRNKLKPVQLRPKHEFSDMSLVLQLWDNYRSPSAFEDTSPWTGSTINTPLHLFHTTSLKKSGGAALSRRFMSPFLSWALMTGCHHFRHSSDRKIDLSVVAWAIHLADNYAHHHWQACFQLLCLLGWNTEACDHWVIAIYHIPPLPDLVYGDMIYCSGR